MIAPTRPAAPLPPVGPGQSIRAAGAGARPLGIGSADTPPFRLPGEHFAAALVFLVLGTLGLVVVAPELAAGAFLVPQVVAVTHLFTLGWITASIMGALYQFLPVALGQPIRSIGLAHLSFALYVPGLAVFVASLWFYTPSALVAGAATFGSGILLFCANLAATLRRASRRDVTWWALAAADVFLVVTLVFGLALSGNLRWGYLGGDRLVALGTHLHVALAGWVLLVMIGVAQRLLPMFLLSHGAGERGARLAVGFVAAGAGALTVFHHAPVPLARWLPALLLGAGMAAFLTQARAFYGRRIRPSLDPGMRLAAAGLTLLGAGAVLALPVVLGMAPPRLAMTYVTLLVLGIALFVAALYYKIVPFLVWFHRFGPLAGRQPVPRVGELYSARTAILAALCLAAGAGGLAAGVAFGWEPLVRAGAITMAGGAGVEALQMMNLARRRPA